MQKKCKKICVYQKKAVLLHPLLMVKGEIPLPAEAGFPV